MVSTVKVPKAFAPLFEAAEKHVADYFKHRKFNPEKGTIEVSADRYILLRGPAISVEFFQLCRNLFGSDQETEADLFASSFLYELAHSIGKADAKAFHKKMGLEDPIARLSAGPVHFAHTGWAFVDIMEESAPSLDEDYLLVYKHPYSFESHAWMHSSLTSHSPVCTMNAGYSSGWCEESFGIGLEAREISCRALGHEDCLFVMAPHQQLESRIKAYLEQHKDLKVADNIIHADVERLFPNKDKDSGSDFSQLLSHHLFTYARNLESTQASLNNKIAELKSEVDARKLAESSLKLSEKRWRDLSDVLFDSILICCNDKFSHANTASAQLFNRPLEKILQTKPQELFGLSNWMTIKMRISEDNHDPIELEIDLERQTIFIELQIQPANNSDVILAIRDISERVIATRKLERLANIDSLTGLANRQAFSRIVARQLSEEDQQHALLFMDLDKFKQVNDSLGHEVGDLLLFEVARRMENSVRALDSVARIGGDEFIALLPNLLDINEARQIAVRINQALEQGFIINNKPINVVFSIGIAVFPENGSDLETLQRHADKAMYAAKGNPNKSIYFFDELAADSRL